MSGFVRETSAVTTGFVKVVSGTGGFIRSGAVALSGFVRG